MNTFLRLATCTIFFCLFTFSSSPAESETTPMSYPRSVSEVVANLEADYDSVAELRYKKDHWKAWVSLQDKEITVSVEPQSLAVERTKEKEIKRRFPDEGFKSLAEIVRGLERQAYTHIEHIDLKKNGWHVDVDQGRIKVSLIVDPKTGEIIKRKET